MNLMNKIIQSKVRNKKIIFIAVICILIIGIVGLLIFNTIDNSSAKSDNKGNTASKISNNVKEKDKQNEKEDSKGMIEEKNKDSDEDTSVISKKSDDSVNSDKKSDDENKNNSPKSTKSNAETNNSTQKNNSNSSNKSNTSDKSNSSSSNGTNSTNNSSGSVSKPSHEHVYRIPVTQKVHHDAVTKTFTVVDQAAYDEPIYESHQVCKVCGKDFGKGENATVEAINHSVETGHSYHSTSVKVGTKHHDAITHQETKTIVVTPAYDEEKITGYRCSCGKTK